MKKVFSTILCCLVFIAAFSQKQPVKKQLDLLLNNSDTQNSSSEDKSSRDASEKRKDTLGFEHRNDAKDSISLIYRFLNSLKINSLDSSIEDFDRYYSVPLTYQYLGNNGAAAFSLIYQPEEKAGWDPGFHAFDIYKFTLEGTKFYKTTKPFSMLSYQLASGKEQMLKAGHTQNPTSRLNVGFDYKLITAPGFFITQNTNHNSFRLFGNYQSVKKRYAAYWAVVGNNIRASENGGIVNDSFLLDANRKDRFSVPVNMGGSAEYKSNPFVTAVKTGNTYKDFNFLLRQSYDFGKRDSIAINDSTTEYLFYPRLRLQYTFSSAVNRYKFGDVLADSTLYNNWYNINLSKEIDTFLIQENWKVFNNDFSLIQFPDPKNSAQYFLGGVTIQNIKGELATGNVDFHNLSLHGEYRNTTRNKLWDISLNGEFFLNGLNAGDYNIHTSLNKNFNKRRGDIGIFFNNINRTPSFIFDNRSSYNLGNNNSFDKQNITSFGAHINSPIVQIGIKNFLIFNQVFFKNYYQSQQYSKGFDLIQFYASKKISLFRKWAWYTEGVFQKVDAASPIRVPQFFTRNRISYQGKLFKNLLLSTGVEVRYYSAYKANAYSPIMGQFVKQDTTILKNTPDISLYAHFRIKGFAGFLRTENLNTASFQNGFGFINNNFAAPYYPTQGLMIRFGIQWWFVN